MVEHRRPASAAAFTGNIGRAKRDPGIDAHAFDGSPEIDASLFTRVSSGDRDAFFRLVSPHAHTLWTVSWFLAGDELQAEHLAHEAVLNAWYEFRSFPQKWCFRAWLVQILIGEARSRLGYSVAVDKLSDYEPQYASAWQPIPSSSFNSQRFGPVLKNSLLSLPIALRELIVLRDMAGFSMVECAGILRINEAIAKKLLSNARLRLRDTLAFTYSYVMERSAGGAQ